VLAQSQEFGASIVPLETARRLEPQDEASLLTLVDSYTWVALWRWISTTNEAVRRILHNELQGINPRQPDLIEATAKPDNDTPTIDFHYPFVSLAMHMQMAMRRAAYYLRKGLKEAAKEGITVPLQGPRAQRTARVQRIRVVYMSSKFRNHGLSHLVSSMFKAHDRSRFEIICVAIEPDDVGTPYRPRIKATVDQFLEMDHLSQPQMALALHRLQGHVLHDLDGLTRGHKPQALALQPVPVQVNTMEYPGTIGAPYIQYMTTDFLTAPPHIMREGYTEKASYMPWTYFVNSYQHHFGSIGQSTNQASAVRPVQGDSILVSSFNQFYKMDPSTYATWMNALRRTTGTYLWLIKYNEHGVAYLTRETAGHGLGHTRVIFSGTADKPVHLARIAAADLSVDTLRCNGITTTTDTLFFSVPGITMPIEKMSQRAAASIAASGGMAALQQHSLKGYEDSMMELIT